MLAEAGMEVIDWYTDPRQQFGVTLAR